MKKSTFILSLFLLLFASCSDTNNFPQEVEEIPPSERCSDNYIVKSELYYEDEEGNKFLWGGDDPSSHFRINNFKLDVCKLRHGVGRENFPALLDPLYQPLEEVVDNFGEYEKVLILKSVEGVKAYPFSILVKHELLNEVLQGQAVAVVYCFLADLAAVYHRKYCNRTLTFGVSGFTYSDPEIQDGLESFVLWDRDTESLWWPISEEGVAGAFAGTDMVQYDTTKWEELRWPELLEQYPHAVVLRDNQTMDVPGDWPILDPADISCF